MDRNRLWAKSWSKELTTPPRSAFLSEHLKDVFVSAGAVVDATGMNQLSALGIDDSIELERLRKTVRVAAILHDLGKANDHFQGMITRSRNVRENPQGLRHEWVTLLILESLREWLTPALQSESDWSYVEWAIAGHHPAMHHRSPPSSAPDGAGEKIVVLAGHYDFAASLYMIHDLLKLDAPPELKNQSVELYGETDVHSGLKRWRINGLKLRDSLKKSDKRFVALVKNCLIAADIAGSAVPKLNSGREDIVGWIAQSFDSRPEPGDLQSIVDFRLGNQSPRNFQIEVGNSTSQITFVKAGCGGGKSVAGYLWAAKNYPTKRLYFCYPTTGTATEGFRDYLFNPDSQIPHIGAKLFHSRRDIDFEIILGTDLDSDDDVERIEALEAWSTPVVSCTVDAVLGVMQNNRRGMFAWPALAQSAFIFDEIHSYDNDLFGSFLRFLKDVPGVPVLLMTASLPDAREQAIREIAESREIEWKPISGPEEFELLPRYCHLADTAKSLEHVDKTLRDNGKVLWVANTVKRVMQFAGEAAKHKPQVYHSRFKYKDRVDRHAAVIEAFKSSGAALSICSQVAEMSLDLSADLLVMDLAPVPAMIQRLGRLNRRAEVGSPIRPFIVLEPDSHLPYEIYELNEAREWLASLPEAISQRDLVEAWDQPFSEDHFFFGSTWLDGGPITEVKELRAGSNGISILLKSDIDKIRNDSKSLGKYVIPMPELHGIEWRDWQRFRGIPVCPDSLVDYNPLRGAHWRK